MDRLYIQPLTLVPSPQAVAGDAIRLAGGMAYAHLLSVIVVRDGRVVQRELATPSGIDWVLERLPDELGPEAEAQWAGLTTVHPPLQLGDRTIRLDQPQVMGILNVTPDSFSDGGQFLDDPGVAKAHAAAVWEGDEIERVVPAVEHCVAMGAAVSIDTRRPAVMEAALAAGAHLINDVSALRHDPRSLEFAAARGVPVILMHAPGDGDDLHAGGDYGNVVFDVFDWLHTARDRAIEGGISRERILLDPGIGFGKSMAENLALLNALPLFHALGQPLLLGASRKRMIGALSNEAPAHKRLGGSLAFALKGMEAGYQLLRVHDVHETVQARNVWRGLRDAALTDFAALAEE